MRSRLPAASATIVLYVLSGTPAMAAHFVIVDKQIETTPAAAAGSSANPCVFNFLLQGTADTTGRSAVVLARSHTNAAFAEDTCSVNQLLTATLQVTYSLAPDPGEVLGQSVPLCYQAGHDISAQSTAAFTTATQGFGGVPTTQPTEILRNATTIFSAGPNMVMNGTDADGAGGGFSADIGDQITINMSLQTTLVGSGIGTATLRGSNEIYINIGPCAGAPAVSHGGLGVLVIGLAGLAVLRIRRRTAG